MTSDTFATIYHYGSIFVDGAKREVRGPYLTGEAGIYAGYVVRRSSSLLYLCKSGELPFGIAEGELGGDLDTAIDSGDEIEVYPLHSNQIVKAWYGSQSPAVNLEESDIMVLSATDGMLKKFAYTDSAVATDTLSEKIGNYAGDSALTGSTSNNQIIDLKI